MFLLVYSGCKNPRQINGEFFQITGLLITLRVPSGLFQHTVLSNTLFLYGQDYCHKNKSKVRLTSFPVSKGLRQYPHSFFISAPYRLAGISPLRIIPSTGQHSPFTFCSIAAAALLLVVIYIDYYILRFTVEGDNSQNQCE